MIEAVSSVVLNAQLVRSASGAVEASRNAQNQEVSVSEAGSINVPTAPFISPYIQVDNNYNKAVIQIRDSDTGDVLRQFPSEERLREQSRASQETERTQTARINNQEQGSSSQTTPSSAQPSDLSAIGEVSGSSSGQSAPRASAEQVVSAFSAGANSASAQSSGGSVSLTA